MPVDTLTHSASTPGKVECVDTHAHLNFNAFDNDSDEVIRRSLANGIWMINVGSELSTSRGAVELTAKFPSGVFAAIGCHPFHAPGVFALIKNKLDFQELVAVEAVSEFNIQDYRKLALQESRFSDSFQKKRVVAIGEIGLDYYYKPKSKTRLKEFKNLQKEVLRQQIDLAQELGLPIIFHCRVAHEDLVEILKSKLQNSNDKSNSKSKVKKPGRVVHSFVGTSVQAQEYLDLGFYLGFTGIIFKQIPGIDFKEVIRKTPLEKILVETDSPYCVPLPAVALAKTGATLRNEPLFVKYVVKEIARIKNLGYEEVAKITTQNAKNLFNL